MDTNPATNQTHSSSPAPGVRIDSEPHRLTEQERRQRRLNALVKGIDWSHVIIEQVARLHQAERAAQVSEQARRERRDYAQQDRQPFAWLRAEAYFLLGATRQLVRALAAYGDTKNVPPFVHSTAVLTAVRDAADGTCQPVRGT